MLGRWIYNWKKKYIRIVTVEVKIVRQYGVIIITTNLDIICTFIKKTRKYPMYIVSIDFN